MVKGKRSNSQTMDAKQVKTKDDFFGLLKEHNYIFLALPVDDDRARYRYSNCLDAFLALEHMINDYELRSWLKHGGIERQLVTKDENGTRPMTPVEAVEWMRERIWDRFDQEGIDLDKALE